MKNKEKSSFNPEAWQEPSEQPSASKISKVADISSLPGTVSEDIETITCRIEAARVDITAGYDNWRDLGFALSSELGENGRSIFHRISCFNPDYNQQECDKQYDKCLRSHGTGITKSTFFQKAKEAGIDVRTHSGKSPEYSKSPKLSNGNNGNIGNTGDKPTEVIVDLPTFSQDVIPHLPEFLQKIAEVGESPQETDALLIGAIVVISSCLPNIYGYYDGVTVYPNLFYFLTARASSGKGRLSLCRYIVQPIHQRLKEICDEQMKEYRLKMDEWEGKKRGQRGPKPEKPAQTKLFIPANSTATSVYQLLNDNGGKGLIFETEGDTLTGTFEKEHGDFSDGFRKAFHHEHISYHRRTNDENVEVDNPRLSTVLSGTPRQVTSLIGDAENGLFSRFIFYRLNSALKWKNVFAHQDEQSLDQRFTAYGLEFTEFYDALLQSENMKFKLSRTQCDKFNAYFEGLQTEYYNIFKDDILASVRRLGLICFRIAMILSALRMMETGAMGSDIVCEDEEFDSALTISKVLAVHTAKIFEELSSQDNQKIATIVNTSKRQKFLDELPAEFDRQDYLETAERCQTPEGTADKWIRAFCGENGPLEKVEHGRYRKKNANP